MTNDVTDRRPPKLKHRAMPSGTPEIRKELVLTAAKNIRLSGRATKLLMNYTAQSNGFTPSLKRIERETGIAANKISEIRKELLTKGVIGYDAAAGVIVIDWERLRIFALMEHPLSKAESLRGFYSAVRTANTAHKTIGQINAHVQPTALQKLYRLPKQKDVLDTSIVAALNRMTERQYTEMVQSFPEYDPAQQRPMIEN